MSEYPPLEPKAPAEVPPPLTVPLKVPLRVPYSPLSVVPPESPAPNKF